MRLLLALVALVAMSLPGAATARQNIPPVIVYFESGSDALNAASRETLEAYVQLLRRVSAPRVILAGHADAAEGDNAENVGLSQRRALIVREYLAVAGIPQGTMTTQAFGAARPAVPTSSCTRP